MLIKGKYVIADPARQDGTIEDGAVYVDGSQIKDVGKYDRLRKQYPDDEVIGSDDHLVMPGLVNAHDHGRGLGLQLGIADDYLELWLLGMLASGKVDDYLTTAYASALLIESGVTTTMHNHYDPDPATFTDRLAEIARAYREAGLRAVLAMGILDKSSVAKLCERLSPSLPADLNTQVLGLQSRPHLSAKDFFTIFRRWHEEYNHAESERIRVMPSPVSVHWCSDELLVQIQEEARTCHTGIHTHLLETVHQREDALSKFGKTALEHLAELGFLGPHLSCAHCVWVTERDIHLIAESGTHVIHNASSNLRLYSGIAPVKAMHERGVNIAIGMDSNGLNDDGDMFQEMRLAAYLQRVPGIESGLAAHQMLTMATTNGARALLLEDAIGGLTVGKKADLILVRLDRLSSPWVDPSVGIVDLMLYRARAQDVDTVIVDGQIIMRDRKLLKIDKQAIAAELAGQLKRAKDRGCEERAQFIERLKPFANAFYRSERGDISSPHYVFNSREA